MITSAKNILTTTPKNKLKTLSKLMLEKKMKLIVKFRHKKQEFALFQRKKLQSKKYYMMKNKKRL
jgi:hypothetical protein